MEDALGRSWQMGTIQLDFQLPRRFGLKYIDSDGNAKTPVVIHRVIYGALERFIGLLIEHFAGAFPVWLAPVQAKIIPIADRHIAYAKQLAEKLRAEKIRVEIDDSSERMNVKIRQAQLQKIPYMLVIGDREEASQSVAVRLRTEEELGAMPTQQFIELCKKAIAEKEINDSSSQKSQRLIGGVA